MGFTCPGHDRSKICNEDAPSVGAESEKCHWRLAGLKAFRCGPKASTRTSLSSLASSFCNVCRIPGSSTKDALGAVAKAFHGPVIGSPCAEDRGWREKKNKKIKSSDRSPAAHLIYVRLGMWVRRAMGIFRCLVFFLSISNLFFNSRPTTTALAIRISSRV